MKDNPLIELIIKTVLDQEQAAGIPQMPLQQAFQPTQQGVPSEKSAFLFKIGDVRYGYPLRSERYVPPEEGEEAGKIIHTEVQAYETTFQFSALSVQKPENIDQMTASDLCNLFAHILQSDAVLEVFRENGIGILRVRAVQNPYFGDDRARNEANPSFEFTITHKQIVESTTPVIQSTELQILTV